MNSPGLSPINEEFQDRINEVGTRIEQLPERVRTISPDNMQRIAAQPKEIAGSSISDIIRAKETKNLAANNATRNLQADDESISLDEMSMLTFSTPVKKAGSSKINQARLLQKDIREYGNNFSGKKMDDAESSDSASTRDKKATEAAYSETSLEEMSLLNDDSVFVGMQSRRHQQKPSNEQKQQQQHYGEDLPKTFPGMGKP
jgi:hypothetical protein